MLANPYYCIRTSKSRPNEWDERLRIRDDVMLMIELSLLWAVGYGDLVPSPGIRSDWSVGVLATFFVYFRLCLFLISIGMR